ncbi:Diacylglycerol kinase [compost metagenome]
MIAVVFLGLVIELLNSAIEATVDRISLELHPLSRQAKDMGSAAQLLGLILVVVVWAVILL